MICYFSVALLIASETTDAGTAIATLVRGRTFLAPHVSLAVFAEPISLREFGLAGTEMGKAQAGTIRTKLLKIGGCIKVSVRRVWISFSESYPYQHLFERILDNLRRQSPPPLRI